MQRVLELPVLCWQRLPSGLFKIFEGVASLGATLLDLGIDKDRAEAVEEYFA